MVDDAETSVVVLQPKRMNVVRTNSQQQRLDARTTTAQSDDEAEAVRTAPTQRRTTMQQRETMQQHEARRRHGLVVAAAHRAPR